MNRNMVQGEQPESRWPQASDALFVGHAWADAARVVRDPAERFYRMPMGYKRAGDILVDHARTNRADRCNISYVAIFCYRQSIELFLKSLIEEFGDKKEPATHDLKCLWESFSRVLEDGSDQCADVSAAAKLVLEMHQADQGSDAFRFPTMKDGTPFDFGDRGIDLENLREVMEGLANFFECAFLAFSHQNDPRSEGMQFWT